MWEKDKVWDADPVLLPFRDTRHSGGWPATRGPPTTRPPRVTKYIITDLYAEAIQGMPAEAAVKWAYEEIAKVSV